MKFSQHEYSLRPEAERRSNSAPQFRERKYRGALHAILLWNPFKLQFSRTYDVRAPPKRIKPIKPCGARAALNNELDRKGRRRERPATPIVGNTYAASRGYSELSESSSAPFRPSPLTPLYACFAFVRRLSARGLRTATYFPRSRFLPSLAARRKNLGPSGYCAEAFFISPRTLGIAGRTHALSGGSISGIFIE